MRDMFEWKPEYSVQIQAIDAQHQRLFALAGELHTAMSQGKGKAVLEQSLARLVDYTKVHFASEEQLMAKHSYPQLAGHKAQHEQLTAQVMDFQRKFRNGGTTLTVSLMTFLKNWLEHHIIGTDRQYSPYVRGPVARTA
jgi:hemerythrin